MSLEIDTPTLCWPPIEAMRDRYGRYAGAVFDGVEKPWSMPRSRVTTIVGRIEDKYNLTRWEWEMMARGLSLNPDHWDMLLEFVELGDSKAIRFFMESMAEAGGSKDGANRGTRYHELVGMALAGVKLPKDVTLEERRDIKAVLQLFEQRHVEVLDLERIIVNKEYDYAGTLDYRLRMREFQLPVIGDLKTGARLDLSYPYYRAQAAAYCRASHEVTDDGEVVNAPEVDRTIGFLVHNVPGSGKAEFIGMNLLDGWRAFRLAHRVWSHGRGHPRPLSFDEAQLAHAQIIVDREGAQSTWVQQRINVLRSLKSDPRGHKMRATKYLRSIWPEGVALPSETLVWYGDDLRQVIAAVTLAEADYEAPFYSADPTRSL